VLIADQFNNRVIEVNPASHQVVWSFGDGSNVAGPHSIVGTNDAERINGGRTLIAGTGTPANTDPSCPVASFPSGCPDNRVIIVDQQGKIVWQYGQAGVTGSGPDQLNTPVQATALPDDGHFLITDQGNERVIEVNKAHKILWQYGQTGVIGSGPDQLSNPNSAELLANGHILIADENNNRVIEVTRDHQIVATFTDGGLVSGAAFASRLANGDTLITDSNNNRALEVDSHDAFVWQYVTNLRSGSYTNPLPTRAVRLRNGDTLIADQFDDQVIEVTPAGSIVWSQGTIDTSNSEPDPQGFNLLNAPYDAKVIGDYTGLTPPPGNGH
jgi:outer membrane protein assembly factor BamB